MNVLYPKWKEALLQGAANTSLAGTVNAYLVDTAAYVYNASHVFLTDLPAPARVGSPVTLAGKTFVNGFFDAGDLNFVAVSGPIVEALVLVIFTGVEATSRLVGYVDSAINLPFTPSGIDQPVVFSASGIFAI
jgi:hypothetical protein